MLAFNCKIYRCDEYTDISFKNGYTLFTFEKIHVHCRKYKMYLYELQKYSVTQQAQITFDIFLTLYVYCVYHEMSKV